MLNDATIEVDRNYMLQTVLDRKQVLKKRWVLLLKNMDRDGNVLTSTATINKYRVNVAKDYEVCSLLEELLMRIKDDEITVSLDAEAGFEKIADPKER
jgi:hypothetical protein